MSETSSNASASSSNNFFYKKLNHLIISAHNQSEFRDATANSALSTSIGAESDHATEQNNTHWCRHSTTKSTTISNRSSTRISSRCSANAIPTAGHGSASFNATIIGQCDPSEGPFPTTSNDFTTATNWTYATTTTADCTDWSETIKLPEWYFYSSSIDYIAAT